MAITISLLTPPVATKMVTAPARFPAPDGCQDVTGDAIALP
jgi:hypothetical protein